MNIVQKAIQSTTIGKMMLKLTNSNIDIAPNMTGKEKRLSYAIRRQRPYVATLGQDELKLAILVAEDVYNPNRYLLLNIYREVMRDLHVKSQIRTAIYKVIKLPSVLADSKTKKVNLQLTALIQTKWFQSICEMALESEYYGHSLIEFGQLMPDEVSGSLIFKEVKLFPREHTIPEKCLVIVNPQDTQGYNYTEAPFNQWVISCGSDTDLGMLHIVAKYAIYKKFALSDWSRSGEKWGDPLLVIRSSSNDDSENAKKEEFASNFGNNGYAILDKDDEVELLERTNDKGYEINKFFAEFMNDENSKGINGQTATSDNQAYAGTANVQEGILEDYTDARLRNLFYFINDTVLPYLVSCNNGNSAYSALKGMSWFPAQYLMRNADPTQQIATTNDTSTTPAKSANQKKKSLRII